MGTEYAPWAGVLSLAEEATLGTEQEQTHTLPLTSIPTGWPMGAVPVAVEPVTDNISWPTDNFLELGRLGGTVTGFETFMTATWMQWLGFGLVGDVDPIQVGLANVTNDLEYTDSTPANYASFTYVLELGETSEQANSRLLKGCIIPRFSITSGGTQPNKLGWDVIYRETGEPTSVDADIAGSYTSLYNSTDTAKMHWDIATSTWDTANLDLIALNLEYSNGITYDNLKWTDAQKWDEPMLQVPSITGSMTVGWDQASGAATIDADAAARTAKDVALKWGSTGAAGYIELNFPARIIGDLDIKPENGLWTCTFNFEAIDDETNTITIITCAPTATNFELGT